MHRTLKGISARWRWSTAAIFAVAMWTPLTLSAQTGVDDDRISLPEGPGSLEGVGENVEIDPNMGMMRWNVPIVVPQGYEGMTPSLALNYGSGNGSGPFGFGWTLETPTIERMTSRGTPLYVAEDTFAYNGGEELVEVLDESGDKVYRERFEKKFYRYTWVNVGDGEEGYWKVEYPDGRVGYFGADAEGNLDESARTSHPDGGTYRYHLVEIVDLYGHKMRYSYDKFGGNKTLLTDIDYVFLNGEAQYSVQLSYEMRNDLLSDAGAGFEELLEYRVTDLRVLYKEETIRQFVLNYEDYATSGGFSRLTDIQTFGKGGKTSGEDPYPIRFSFEYSKALGVSCTAGMAADCDANKPYIRELAPLQGAVNLSSGKSTFIDINGDALPDVLDTTDGQHKFFINKLVPDGNGGWEQSFEAPKSTSINTSLQLGGDGSDVQVLDINGDGYADLVDTETGSFLLNDPKNPDWMMPGNTLDVTNVKNINFPDARFMDYNNDKKIDIVVASQADALQVFRNTGDGFEAQTLEGVGVIFSSERVQLSDMNGDGLNDIIELIGSDSLTVRYKINLGLGRYTDWESITGLTIASSEIPNLDFEDLNGDGISDVVIVNPTEIKYMINRNGNAFDAPVIITSAQLDGELPLREMGVRVLYSDMNANGSEDVVWLDSSGKITYLELFPTRPNLISKIDNGIGFVQNITYGTAAEHASRAKAAGNPWEITLPNAMPIVDRVDIYVTLTGQQDGSGLHEIIDYTYRNGFYDGLEKQFRGFVDVVTDLRGGENQEAGRTIYEFNVGQLDPWYNGLQERVIQESGGDVLTEKLMEYADCDVDGAPAPALPLDPRVREQVRFICTRAEENIVKERQTDPSKWVTLRKEFEYDGYGNVTLERDLGDKDAQGDELHVETEYASSDSSWIIKLPSRVMTYNDASKKNEERAEELTYYDGPAFEGLELGKVEKGFVSRMQKLEQLPSSFITDVRNRADEHGNVIETIGALGSPEELDAHRRTYTYDPMGIYVGVIELRTKGPDGAPYQLRREARYDYTFGNVIEATDWMLSMEGTPQTARRATNIKYDRFGRVTAISKPGDNEATPTQSFAYELGAPVSRVAFLSRSELNGAVDEESFRCFDGKGRLVQTRTKVKSGEYLVTGFTAFNARGTAIKIYEPYTSQVGDCELTEPAGVRFTSKTLDASFRTIEATRPDAELYGEASTIRTVFLPLEQLSYDEEDTDEMSPHFDTPMIKTLDGLGRVKAITRTYKDGADTKRATMELFYDNTNSIAGYTDPAGNRHSQERDLIGRIVKATNPNYGTLEATYDAAGNVTQQTDARGETVRYSYDGVNRVTAVWNDKDRDGTLATTLYDMDKDCALTECTNGVGQQVSKTYTISLGEGISARVYDRFGYDVRARLIFAGRQFGELVDLATTTQYDNQDRKLSMTMPDGVVITREYDKAGRDIAMPGYLNAITYDDRGLLSEMSFVNNAKMTVTHDALQRYDSLKSVDGSGAPLEGWDYTRDRLGNILNVVDLGSRGSRPSTAADFVYDDWYRVVTAQLSVGTADQEILGYTYNEIDNILSATSDLGDASPLNIGEYTYGAQPNIATAAGEIALTHDASGYMKTRGDATLTWDYLGRLVKAESARGDSHYAYGFAEERVAKREGSSLTLYGYDNFQVRDGVGVSYVRMGRQQVARHETPQFGASFYDDANGDGNLSAGDAFMAQSSGALPAETILMASAARVLAEEEDAKTFLHSDHLGSLTAATDEGGAVRGQRAYAPFGERRWEEGYVDEYGFTGQERDAHTGLLHFQYRYLDTYTGRWASFDPAFTFVSAEALEKYAQLNGYAYVENNPLNSVDPLGLNAKSKNKSKSQGRKRSNATSKKSGSKSKGDKSNKSTKSADKDKSASKDSGDKNAGGLGAAANQGLGTAKTAKATESAVTSDVSKMSDSQLARTKQEAETKTALRAEKNEKKSQANATASLVSGISSSVASLGSSITFSVLNISMNANQAALNEQRTSLQIEELKGKADKGDTPTDPPTPPAPSSAPADAGGS